MKYKQYLSAKGTVSSTGFTPHASLSVGLQQDTQTRAMIQFKGVSRHLLAGSIAYMTYIRLAVLAVYSGTGLESRIFDSTTIGSLNESVNQILGVRLLMCALNLE